MHYTLQTFRFDAGKLLRVRSLDGEVLSVWIWVTCTENCPLRLWHKFPFGEGARRARVRLRTCKWLIFDRCNNLDARKRKKKYGSNALAWRGVSLRAIGFAPSSKSCSPGHAVVLAVGFHRWPAESLAREASYQGGLNLLYLTSVRILHTGSDVGRAGLWGFSGRVPGESSWRPPPAPAL